jgi:hypothetical protein
VIESACNDVASQEVKLTVIERRATQRDPEEYGGD